MIQEVSSPRRPKKIPITQTKLDIIFLTDIHNNRKALQNLANQVKTSGVRYNYCFVGGDVVNTDYHTNSHNETEQQKNFVEILIFLRQTLQCKILFIPGNHDPKKYFQGHEDNLDDIINMHKKQWILDVGLQLRGFGGSTPGFLDYNQKQKVWNGYPFIEDQQLSKQLQTFLTKQQLTVSKIFLTHNGPSLSGTSLSRSEDKTVYAGSKYLNKILEQQTFVAYLHGHVHCGAKLDRYKGKQILNPGAFCFGQYMTMSLVRQEKQWKMKSVSFQKLF